MKKAKRRFHTIVNVSKKVENCTFTRHLERLTRYGNQLKSLTLSSKLLSCSENDNSSMAVFILFHHT